MDKPEFYQRLAEILDVEDVQPENALKGFDGWDSPGHPVSVGNV